MTLRMPRLLPILPLLLLLLPPTGAWAADGAGGSAGFWAALFDNVLGVSILVVFISAIVVALVQARRRDRVLRDFDGYSVVVILEGGKRIWGVARVFPNGIVLRYRKTYIDPDGNAKNSFVLHASELPAVRAILRRDQDLRPRQQARRKKELQRFHNPSLARRARRWTLIQLSILRDALVKSISLIIGQVRRRAAPASTIGSVVASQETEIQKASSTVVGVAVELANDPILESFFARPCYAEIKEGERWREVPGILKEYSPAWLELLDSVWPIEVESVLAPGELEVVNQEANCRLAREGDELVVQNQPPEQIEVVEVFVDGEKQPVNRTRLGVDCSLRVMIEDSRDKSIRVRMISHEPADVILPRSVALVRHLGPIGGRSRSAGRIDRIPGQLGGGAPLPRPGAAKPLAPPRGGA